MTPRNPSLKCLSVDQAIGKTFEYLVCSSAKLEIDRSDAVDPRQFLLQETLVGAEIGHDDTQ